jgi:hypothetical protein
MGVVMRIIQQFDPAHEDDFMELEEKFHELERNRQDYPQGKRMQPISSHEPANTLVWQYEFPDLDAAYKTLTFFSGDMGHEELFRKQVIYIKQVKIEFYKTLDF